MVHGRSLRSDQIPAVKALGVFPALFPMHTFYWGDWHRGSVAGPERAENISPTGWVIGSDLKMSIHSDAPVVFPNSMVLISTAVNRTTRSGRVLGGSQRLPPLQALYAMTLWPAYQHFEEETKGSIEVGKRADLVILSDNPLTVLPARLADIRVDETIKDGLSIYRRETAPAARWTELVMPEMHRRRLLKTILFGSTAIAIPGAAWAQVPSLSDIGRAMPGAPTATIYSAREIITLDAAKRHGRGGRRGQRPDRRDRHARGCPQHARRQAADRRHPVRSPCDRTGLHRPA